MLSLNYPGLGLPTTQFNKFASLLSRFTNENACYGGPGGYCLLTKTCESYDGLGDLSFKVEFKGDLGYYFIIPFATFAFNT